MGALKGTHYNGYPVGVPICTPTGCIGAGNEPKASGRATNKRKVATYNGCPLGHPYACPHRGHALMGWVPYPPHMGPHFVGPITPFGLQK